MKMGSGRSFIPLLLIAGLFFPHAPAIGHELIPKNLQEYIKSHPGASEADLRAFITTDVPQLVSGSERERNVVEAFRGKKRGDTVLRTIWNFLALGVGHILSGPDHILFVLSLLLAFVSLRDILALTATFTVAHTITLILSGAGILTIPPRITEPLIALSIAVVAISSVFFKASRRIGNPRVKIGMVFFFGLFHGLGFAGLLKEVEIPKDAFATSLLSFNAGIEIGQLLIIALALPLIFRFRGTPRYDAAMRMIAILISLLALFWFVTRLAG